MHDLRHTFASWLVTVGVSPYVVKDLFGHSSITVTERYAHLAPHMGREAVRTLHADWMRFYVK
ncbi:integrase [Burkholderia ubonensis]|uniref:tyrosine-type recombinase/integrase n=1 Tax=Burkholderia ubonensis TaxID=101571 RepID=UPI000756568C|nr:tyrosine-type recombinase/integrase [Burkholderia ubonensis]KVV45550.1 integrase [Burkholderia ubonensis]